jgi:hypothetical protein
MMNELTRTRAMGRSEERRRAVRISAMLSDMKDCIRGEKAAEAEHRHRPLLQATGGRARYVTLRPPRPRPPPDAGAAAGAAAAPAGAAAAGAQPADAAEALVPQRTREPRIGPAFQATRFPAYNGRCGRGRPRMRCVLG